MLSIVKVRVDREPTAEEIAKREAEWLKLIEADKHECEWVEVDGFEVCTAIRLPIGPDESMKRAAVTYGTAQKAAELLSARLPTKEQADAVLHAAKHIAPIVSRPYHKGSPTSASLESMIAISDRIDLVSKGETFVDNDGKFWLRGAPFGRAINYGLVDIPNPRKPNVPPVRANGLHMWQDVGRTAHNSNHVDGTQYMRFVRAKEHTFEQGRDVPRSYLYEIGQHVLEWQRYLRNLSIRYADGKLSPGPCDSMHGPLTDAATDYFLSGDWRRLTKRPSKKKAKAKAKAKPVDKVVGSESVIPPAPAVAMPKGEFVQAKSYTKGRVDKATGKPCAVRVCVIHVAQIAEVMTAAESLAAWANREAPVSWHYAVDADSYTQSVNTDDTAWAAPGCNHDGIQYELAGWAEQTTEEWHDKYSLATLDNAAKLVAADCLKYNVPIVKISSLDLTDGKRGICGHDDVSHAYKKSTHTDPGKAFPWKEFIGLVKHYADAMKGASQ